ncbi:flocculation protein FLO11-like isoform X2 [Homarus americanus]|uniref:flocculation protein FLO11-like isoform X2 n=1 Tax=Homarus americanus TaxID=6706 RepID=UPI001C46A80F|nr:flocculation protein FLO11-like isoform X2 [Homarus americanus]
MDVVGVGGIEAADMVTMRGEGVSVGSSGSGTISDSTSGLQNSQGLECHTNGTGANGDTQWKILSQDSSKMSKIREIVENSASVGSKCVVESLVQQVSQLSDVEKFLLYLKLPVGRPPDTDPLKHPLNPLGSRCEIQLTITWIRTHLEMNSEVSLPKREVYNEYMHYCNLNDIKALSTADFGKVMKQVFPGVRPRRLGQRGASKYCYSGLRKKWALDPPDLPDLNDNMTKKNMLGVDCVVDESEVERAASCLVLEWAEKLCSFKFECIRDLALHLVHKNYVDNRSVAAFTLLSVADQKQGVLVGSGATGGKHRETQLQLQRKLQEREHIREQKRKLQEQQPPVNKCNNERPKSRRRSGASSRNPSGETLANGTPPTAPNNKTGPNSGGHLPTATSINATITTTTTTTTTNGNCDSLTSELPNGATNDISSINSNNVLGIATIKQEQTLDFLDSLTDDKILEPKCNVDGKNGNFNSNIITNVGHTHQPVRRNCSTSSIINSFGSEVKKPLGNKVPISKSNPAKKTFLLMPSTVPKSTSPKARFKAIQPKVTENNQGALTGGSQWTDIHSGGTEDLSHPRAETLLSNNMGGSTLTESMPQQQGQRELQQVISNNNCTNNQETEDEFMQYFHKTTVELDDAQKSNQISELRKLLQRNLPGGQAQGGVGGGVRPLVNDADMLDQDASVAGGMRRRVSFQPSLDGGEALNSLMGGQTVGSVPPSPNTRRTQFNFTPISSNLDQAQGMSQCSSANASPFMSPRNTPLPRSRHNSGQTSSTYVTPRSTPFTPDQPNYPVTSECSTPFMSPIPTPLFPRSRHNSSQNLRTPYTPTCRSRHSSGAPTFRHAPYTSDDMSSRRGGKYRSRHSSGSVPPSPSSAPLSPLVQDGSLLPQHENMSLQLPSASMLHHMLKNKQPVGSGINDLRRRHMSAGPTIHYQPQPPAFPTDPLAQEISSVMTNSQPGPSNAPSGNSNRPQSVPLLQMITAPPCNPETFPKSQPNTPLVNQQFTFADCCVSQPSSYAPTPVPSEYNDFTDSYNLDIDPMLDVNLQSDAGASVGLDSMESLNMPESQSADLSTLSDPLQVPPNINPFSMNYQNNGSMRTMDDQISRNEPILGGGSCCMDNLRIQQGDIGSGAQGPLMSSASMLTLNALNRSGLSLETGGSVGLEEDFQPTLGDLGDQEVFNSLVLDVNKD